MQHDAIDELCSCTQYMRRTHVRRVLLVYLLNAAPIFQPPTHDTNLDRTGTIAVSDQGISCHIGQLASYQNIQIRPKVDVFCEYLDDTANPTAQAI